MPGIGPLIATAIAVPAPPPGTFRKARDLFAGQTVHRTVFRSRSPWPGLTPRQHSTGGRQRLGAEPPGAVEAITAATRATRLEPEEVWCAAGSGVLARGFAAAWPNARRHVVQVGRDLSPRGVAGAQVHRYPLAFRKVAKITPPFPGDPHHDAKAWEV